MIRFKTITIENLFGIEGKVEHALVDLESCSNDRGNLLVHGGDLGGIQAGFALRLLFGGSWDPSLRNIGFPPRTLTIEEFVLGRAGIWDGIVAPQMREGDLDGCARLCVEMDHDGSTVLVERRWMFDGPRIVEDCRISGPNEPADADTAARLARIIPSALLPLFFTTGNAACDLFDDPVRCRAAIDAVSAKDFLETLAAAVGGSGSSYGTRPGEAAAGGPELQWYSSEAERRKRRDAVAETRLSEHCAAIRRELRATTQELQRLADALSPEFLRVGPIGAVHERLLDRNRPWLERTGTSSAPKNGDKPSARVLQDLELETASRSSFGTAWAELRFIEVSAMRRRLEQELATVEAALPDRSTYPTPFSAGGSGLLSDEDYGGERASGTIPIRERLMRCLRELAEAVRVRRCRQISADLERFDWSIGGQTVRIGLYESGELSFTSPTTGDLGRANIPLEIRQRVGLALAWAFARAAGRHCPIVVDKAFSHAAHGTRVWAARYLFDGRDA